MKKTEVMDVFMFLSGCYPIAFKRVSNVRLEQMVNSWCEVFSNGRFANLDGQRLMESAKRHVMGERGRSFPTPRDLIDQMDAYSSPEEAPEASSS